mgnify:CR=1 FL=1
MMLAFAATVGAQTKDGGISAQMMQQIRQAQKQTTADRALFNAIAANNIDNLAKNHKAPAAPDTYFSVETPAQSITDQKQSGRCWMFSGMNVLRSNFAQKSDSLTVEFSQAYLFFYDQLEKANLFLQGVIDCAKKPMDDQRVQFFFKNPINDGGTFCGVADLTAKYGLVPKSVMPETFSSDNTRRMAALLSSKLREYGLQLRDMVNNGKKPAELRSAKEKMLGTIYHMLSLTIGEPPTQFTYAFKNSKGREVAPAKTYTPQSFYKEVVGEPLPGTFIMVMNDPRRPYHKTYEVELDRHTYDGTNWKYLNLPMEDIEQLAITALKAGKKMYSSYDVAKFLNRDLGYCDLDNYDYGSLFSTTFPMNKAQRISTFDSGSTHAMTLTAVDLDANGKPLKWKVENSWGATWGQKGCLIMTNNWFEEYRFRLVVDKQFVSPKLLEEFNQKPVQVMPEDPLFGVDE